MSGHGRGRPPRAQAKLGDCPEHLLDLPPRNCPHDQLPERSLPPEDLARQGRIQGALADFAMLRISRPAGGSVAGLINSCSLLRFVPFHFARKRASCRTSSAILTPGRFLYTAIAARLRDGGVRPGRRRGARATSGKNRARRNALDKRRKTSRL